MLDSSYLRDPKLRDFFISSRDNYVAVCEYLAIEFYKDSSGKSLERSIEILKDFPNQVIVLRNIIDICGEQLNEKNYHEKLIDFEQTDGFALFCKQLKSMLGSSEILYNQYQAELQVKRIHESAKDIFSVIGDVSKILTKAEIKSIRKREEYSDDLVNKILNLIIYVTFINYKNHPKIKNLQSLEGLEHSYIFRNSLCYIVYFLKWIEGGSRESLRIEKIQNSLVDLMYVTFGLYFNGVMTKDKDLNDIYLRSNLFLKKHIEKISKISLNFR